MKKNLVGHIIFFILILAIFYQFLCIDLFDADFWWHVTTGRYIVTTGTLPSFDPFSYASGLEENRNLFSLRENFILKQYWLGQVIFYFVFNSLGPAGIILLRASLLTITAIIVLVQLRKWQVSIPVTFLAVFGISVNLMRAIGERPVLFTIVFWALVFFILEDFRTKRSRKIYWLLPVMLVWSNLHGGFILGIVLITAFMLVEGLRIIFRKDSFQKKDALLFYIATCFALALSWVNPTGWDAFLIAFSSKYSLFTKDIQEYRSPVLYFFNKVYPLDRAYVAGVILFPLILAVRMRKLDLTHVFLLTGTLVMSLVSIRFDVYYVTIASMILGREIDLILLQTADRLKVNVKFKLLLSSGLIVACLVSSIFFAAGVARELPRLRLANVIPVRAVDFIEKNNLQDNIFNDFAYGGYMSWRLYPRKTFIDSRALNLQTLTEYGWIIHAVKSVNNRELAVGKKPLWKRLLDNYRINAIFLSNYDPAGTVLRLTLDLAESNEWVPVYIDNVSVIFVRNNDPNKEIIASSTLTPESVYSALIASSSGIAMTNLQNVYPLIGIGQTFYRMGRLEDALTAYRYAMKRRPGPELQNDINLIEAELKTREKKKEGMAAK